MVSIAMPTDDWLSSSRARTREILISFTALWQHFNGDLHALADALGELPEDIDLDALAATYWHVFWPHGVSLQFTRNAIYRGYYTLADAQSAWPQVAIANHPPH